MTRYVSVTQAACAWLLTHSSALAEFQKITVSRELLEIAETELSFGPIRLAQSRSTPGLFVCWNKDFLTGTGSESWGIVKIDEEGGLDGEPAISQQVFERQIYVINQRLQGLIIDGDFIHRAWPNGAHTCLSGRGNDARKFSICYNEIWQGGGSSNEKSLIIVGPMHDFDRLHAIIAAETKKLASLFQASNETIEVPGRRPAGVQIAAALRSTVTGQNQSHLKFSDVNVSLEFNPSKEGLSFYETMSWTYDDWIKHETLNEAQRRVLSSDILLSHPVRVSGPAGSGKTLLMQLLAMRHLRAAEKEDRPCRVIYVVHNGAMVSTVLDRLKQLGAEDFLTGASRELRVTTLSDYSKSAIGVNGSAMIERDASDAKRMQLDLILKSLLAEMEINQQRVDRSKLFTAASSNQNLLSIISNLISAEVSSVIKGRGLTDDRKRYVKAETPFSRLHRILNTDEREIVFGCFERYHSEVFEEMELLDADDLALTLGNQLRTPFWKLKRKTEGFDFIFVDEAQLFNENERRIFPLLVNGSQPHTPIALALDEAQDLYGFSSAGLATLGISEIENESLPSNHRSTKDIIDLSFFFIQKTTDLFNADFPNFSDIEGGAISTNHRLAARPRLIRRPKEQERFGRFIVNEVKKLRSNNIRQVAVVCHAPSYWMELKDSLIDSQLPLHIVEQRGEKISPDEPLVILTRPPHVGGQEFDAVLSVGLEHNLVPPKIVDNSNLEAAIEQQILRELYLVTSRARFQFHALVNFTESPNSMIREAIENGLIDS